MNEDFHRIYKTLATLEQQEAVEFLETLEYQVNQLSLAKAQLQEAVEFLETLEYQVNQLSLAKAQLQEAVEFLETELRKMRDRFVQEVPVP